MVLDKSWHHTAITCAKKKVLTQLKVVKKLKFCTLQLLVTNIS